MALNPVAYTEKVVGSFVWRQCQERAGAVAVREGAEQPVYAHEERPRYGPATLVRPRLGQGGFRMAVTEAYGRACAVTQEHSLPVLEAAHIQAFAKGGPQEVRNGLLLRADLHRLFDTGYVTVTQDLKLEVSPRLYDDYRNGRSYRPLEGSKVWVPKTRVERPAAELLAWHNEHVFLNA